LNLRHHHHHKTSQQKECARRRSAARGQKVRPALRHHSQTVQVILTQRTHNTEHQAGNVHVSFRACYKRGTPFQARANETVLPGQPTTRPLGGVIVLKLGHRINSAAEQGLRGFCKRWRYLDPNVQLDPDEEGRRTGSSNANVLPTAERLPLL
jgi:hypothetical protein